MVTVTYKQCYSLNMYTTLLRAIWGAFCYLVNSDRLRDDRK